MKRLLESSTNTGEISNTSAILGEHTECVTKYPIDYSTEHSNKYPSDIRDLLVVYAPSFGFVDRTFYSTFKAKVNEIIFRHAVFHCESAEYLGIDAGKLDEILDAELPRCKDNVPLHVTLYDQLILMIRVDYLGTISSYSKTDASFTGNKWLMTLTKVAPNANMQFSVSFEQIDSTNSFTLRKSLHAVSTISDDLTIQVDVCGMELRQLRLQCYEGRLSHTGIGHAIEYSGDLCNNEDPALNFDINFIKIMMFLTGRVYGFGEFLFRHTMRNFWVLDGDFAELYRLVDALNKGHGACGISQKLLLEFIEANRIF